jgi:regulatory protein
MVTRLRYNARSKSGSTVAQRWRVPRLTSNRNIPRLHAESLRALALRYVERYATTRARLTRYLERKLYERGWDGEGEPPVAQLVEKMAGLGYVDDRQFAEQRAAALTRRGYGGRRIQADLRAAGIDADDAEPALPQDEAKAREAALVFARRKRIGPFAIQPPDEAGKRRAFAAMARAGHSLDIIRQILTNRDQD